jgi:hypothetical protein
MARFAELHDGTRLEFPDGTSDEVIQSTVKRMVAQQAPAPKGLDTQPGIKAQGAKMPTAGRAFINAAQGPLFGFADELGGAVAAGVDKLTGRNPGMGFGDLYTRYRDVARGGSDQFQKDNPVLSPALQVGSALATGVGLGRLAPAAPMLAPATTAGRIGAATLAGGGSGALGGAGSAETMEEVPFGMLTGGAFGAITGGTVNAIGQGGGALGSNMVARAGNSRIVQDRLRDTGIGGSFARRVASTADDLAKQRVATALTRDGRTTGQTAARLDTLGDDATLAVAGGKNTRDLLDTMATMPGRTGDDVEKAIRAQQAGRAGRLIDAAEKGLGTGGMRLSQTLQGLDEARSKAAGPIYQQLRTMEVPVSDDLADLLVRARPAFGDARRLADLNGQPFDLDDALKRVMEARRTPMNLSNSLTQKNPPPTVNLGQLDTLKRQLYDMEQANINPETGRLNEIGNAIKNLRRNIVAKVDDATRDDTGRSLYEAARNVYAGPSELRAAANLGSQVITKPGWKIDALTDGMGDAERQAFRIGAMESLREKLGREGGQTEVLKMWKEPATRDRLQAIFPDLRSYREFAAEVAKEARKKSLETVGRGSQTAARQARMDDEGAAFMANAVDAGTALKIGNPLGAMSAIRNLYGRTVMPEPVRDQIGSMLLTRGPQAQGLLGDLSRYVDDANSRRAAAAARSGLLGGVGINSLLGQ